MAQSVVGRIQRLWREAGESAPWVEWVARTGYAAKGVVYALVGVLAADAAFDAKDRPAGSRGALLEILTQPLGRALLGVIALGLAAYVLWKVVEALLDPGEKGTDLKGIGKRIGYGISAAVYGLLVYAAVQMVADPWSGGRAERSGTTSAEHWTALVMARPLGRWVIAAVGVGIILFGLYEMYKGITNKLVSELDLTDLPGSRRDKVRGVARFGLAARGVVFEVIGFFSVLSALHYDPAEARGLGGALRTLESQPYGPGLVFLVAVGLIAFGVYELVKARYRVVRPV